MNTRTHVVGGRRFGKSFLPELTRDVAEQIVEIDLYSVHSRQHHIAKVQSLVFDALLAASHDGPLIAATEWAFFQYQDAVMATLRRQISGLEQQLKAAPHARVEPSSSAGDHP